MDRDLVETFQLDPSWGIWTDFFLKIVKDVPLGSSDGGLVAKWEGEVIGEVDGATLGEIVKWE